MIMRIENAPYEKAVMGGNEYAIQNSPKNVAAAIYKANVTQQNISILTPDNVTIVSTFGPFLDRCTDLDYTNKKIIPELTAMQTLQQPVPQVKLYRYNGINKDKGMNR